MLDIVPIAAFADNYIWTLIATAETRVRTSAGEAVTRRACVVVDPGDAAPVEAFLAAQHLELVGILITHHHADHTGGIAALTARRDIPVYGPAKEKILGVTEALNEGDWVELPAIDAITLKVIEIPGHTRGHIAYVGDDFVFCGDTLFAAGCGRLFEGTPAQMHESLQRLGALPDATRVFCTHEYTLSNLRFALAVDPENSALIERSFADQATRERGAPTVPSTIGKEKLTNPFLRCDTPAVRAHAEQFVQKKLHGAADVFAAIRAHKDVFRS
jgi:hydroxyacylglutathione hydrolase